MVDATCGHNSHGEDDVKQKSAYMLSVAPSSQNGAIHINQSQDDENNQVIQDVTKLHPQTLEVTSNL